MVDLPASVKAIQPHHLTADFFFQDIQLPVGKFDPYNYPSSVEMYSDHDWNSGTIQQCIVAQLEASLLFDDETLMVIDCMDPITFSQCIVLR